MVTVHRVPVIDDKEEFQKFRELEDVYTEVVTEYADSLFFYKDMIEDGEPDSRTVEYAVDRLGESYEELRAEERDLDRFLEESSIRGHISQPHLDQDTFESLERDYNVDIQGLMQEDPETFYFNFAMNYVEEDYTEWNVETQEVTNLKQLISLSKECLVHEGFSFDIENELLPETSPPSVAINPNALENIAEIHEKASDRRLYEHISSLEPHVYREHDVSVMEELWGMDMNAGIIDQIENNDGFMRASNL